MKVGIIGSGGREHAICSSLNSSKKISKIFCFPGNAGTAEIAENINLDLDNFELLKLASNTTVGQVAILTIMAHTLICCTIFTVNKVGRIVLIVCNIGIVISFAMVGHSSTNGYLAQLLLLIHLTCISYWLGSFIPLRQLCKYSNYKVVSNVAHKFGVYAVSYVGLLVLSGIFYSYILLGDIRNIFSTSYGIILLIKFISVNLLLLIGALNKFRYVYYIFKHIYIYLYTLIY